MHDDRTGRPLTSGIDARRRIAAFALLLLSLVLPLPSSAAGSAESSPAELPSELPTELPSELAPESASQADPAPTEASQYWADRILPDWRYRPQEEWGTSKRVAGRSASVAYDFINDSVTDAWSTATSPIRWKFKDWLLVGTAAGVTAGLIFYADQPLREAAQQNDGFKSFGEGIRWIGTGGGLVATTGGFLLSGLVLDRQKDIDTARMLLEASLIGQGYGLALKYTAGRARPRFNHGPKAFDPFSGWVSMPSGEALNVFIIAGVVTSQYPEWWVQILSYGIASAVGAGRIALDAHWGSDVFVSAVIGIAVSKTVVKLNRARARDREAKRKLELSGDATPSLRKRKGRHRFHASARSFAWSYEF